VAQTLALDNDPERFVNPYLSTFLQRTWPTQSIAVNPWIEYTVPMRGVVRFFSLGLIAGLALIGPFQGAFRTQAHTISLTYSEVVVDEQGVRWLLRLPVPELDLLLGLDENHDAIVDAAELQRGKHAIDLYISSKVMVYHEGQPLPATNTDPKVWFDSQGNPFVEVTRTFSGSGASLTGLRLHCDLLREVVAGHQTLAKITASGKTVNFVFANGQDDELQEQTSRWAAFLQFVHMGIMHIFTGYDHIAFLLGVVLIGGSFGTILKVVTSFTVAHSITLALAALNIVHLPSRLVESGIALSIMYIAIENIFFKKFDRRWIVTFFFGLVHGFGFASALEEVHLSGSILATALFSFNFGVELGQVCIVALMLPALWYLKNYKFHDMVVRAVSTTIFLLGTFWLWQRVTGA
jgi:hydrogenase/urease accessory protein HupE